MTDQPTTDRRRNQHCMNCGDTRGGPIGHETSECTYDSLAAVTRRQMDHAFASAQVVRVGWSDEQYLDDARRLLGSVDGSLLDLVNGHAMAMLHEIDRLSALVDSLQGRLDTAEGRLAKARELHQPERRYTPDDGETSYATYSEAADASFDGVGTPRSVTFFEVCSHCASLELGDGYALDYRESLWPCKDAVALGLSEGVAQ